MLTMMENMATSAIGQLLQRMGLSYEPQADGTATLYMDGLRIQLTPYENKLRLCFKIGDLPDDTWARDCKLLEVARFAAGSLANMDTNHETLTISKNALEILLFRVLAVDQMDVDKCLENLAQFVDAAEYWQRAVGMRATSGSQT